MEWPADVVDEDQSDALSPPAKHKDGQWQVKIEKAKIAREEGDKLRAGKEKAFSIRRAVSDNR